MCSQTKMCNQINTQVNLIQMCGVEVWLASTSFCRRVQLTDVRDFLWLIKTQTALGVTLYQGRWALILDSVGELGCRESYSTCGGNGPHNILSLSFVRLSQRRADSFATMNIQ